MYNREGVKAILLRAKKMGEKMGDLKPKYQQMTDEELTAWVDKKADESDMRHSQENSKKE